jgi:Holliday junction resolvasome RuvABC endonuclease subunit
LAAQTILALDQSTQITGYAIFSDEGKLIKHGIFSPSGDYIERITKLKNWMVQIIQEYNCEITVSIEDIQLQKIPNSSSSQNVLTYKKLAHVQGALLVALTELKVQYSIVPSVTWKSKLGVKGARREQQKKSAQLFVKNTYGIDATEDEADAICIGTYTLNQSIHNWE